MVSETASSANEFGLRAPRLRVDAPALRTRLRAVCGRHLDECTTGPCKLVPQALREEAPTGVEDSSRETTLLLLHHTVDLELLNADHTVALGVHSAERLNKMLTLPTHLAVNTSDAELGLLPVLRSFLFARDAALSTGETRHRTGVEPRRFDEPAIRVGDEIHDAAIDGYNRLGAENRVSNLHLTRDRSEPLIPVSFHGASLRSSFQWPVDDRSKISDLGESNHVAIEPPFPGMRFAKTGRVILAPALPPRSTSEFLEALSPCHIQLDEKLRAHILGDVVQPGQFRSKPFQFELLIERCVVPFFTFASSKTEKTLLVGKVPQETQSISPRRKPGHLCRCRVDAVAEALADQHRLDILRGYVLRKGFSEGLTLCGPSTF